MSNTDRLQISPQLSITLKFAGNCDETLQIYDSHDNVHLQEKY